MDRLDKAYLVDGPGRAVARVRTLGQALRDQWDLSTWVDQPNRPDLITLALYLDACTPPNARIFVQPYIPHVLALARRGFAAGYGDLRPGFFETPEAQALALQRMRRQDVPVVLLDIDKALANFRESFPVLTAYFDVAYEKAGTHTFDDRFGITLLVRSDARQTGTIRTARLALSGGVRRDAIAMTPICALPLLPPPRRNACRRARRGARRIAGRLYDSREGGGDGDTDFHSRPSALADHLAYTAALPRNRRKTGARVANRNGAGRMTLQQLADHAVRTFLSRLRPCERSASRTGRPWGP